MIHHIKALFKPAPSRGTATARQPWLWATSFRKCWVQMGSSDINVNVGFFLREIHSLSLPPFQSTETLCCSYFFSPIKISEMKYFYPFPSEEHLLFWLPNPPWNKAKVQWNSSIPRREKQLLCPLHYLSPGFYSLSRVFPAPRPCHLIALQPQMFLCSLETSVTDSSAVCCVAGSHFLLL